MRCLQDILAEINSQLRAGDVLLKIGHFPDKITGEGAQIKCFCPLHDERAFRSLLVDDVKKRFRCTFLKCPGFKGGTLIDLYSKAKRIDLSTAATELASEFEIPIDESSFGAMAADLIEHARGALSQGDLDGALADVEQACDLEPRDANYRRLHADVLRQKGLDDDATLVELEAAAIFQQEGDSPAAIELLEALRESCPGNMAVAGRLGLALSQAGRPDAAAAVLRAACSSYDDKDSSDERLGLIELLLQAAPGDLEATTQAARVCAAKGMANQAVVRWEQVAQIQVENGNGKAALEALDRLRELDPNSPPRRSLRAAALAADGRQDEASEEMLALAQCAIESGSLDQGEEILLEILESAPDRADAVKALATLYEKTDRAAEAAAAFRWLADLWSGEEDGAWTIDALRRAKELEPESVAAREALLKIHIARGDDEAAREELDEMAARLDEPERASESLRLSRLLSELSGCPVSLRLAMVLRAAGDADHRDSSRKEMDSLIGDAFAGENWDDARLACVEGLKVWQEDSELLSSQIEALKQGRDQEALRPAYDALCRVYAKEEDWTGLCRELRRALADFPEDRDFSERLAEACARNGESAEAATILHGLADGLKRRGDLKSAWAAVERIQELVPGDLISAEKLLAWAEEAGERDKAVSLAQQLAVGADQAGDLDRAESAWRKLVSLQADSLAPLRGLADFLAKRRTSEAAVPVLERVLETALEERDRNYIDWAFEALAEACPEDNQIREKRADWLAQAGETNRAAEQLRELSRRYAKNDSAERQAAVLDRLAKLRPDDVELIAERARIEERAGHGGKSACLWIEFAETCRRQHDGKGALDGYRNALRIGAPEDEIDAGQVRLALAELLESEKQFKEAESMRLWLSEAAANEGDAAGSAAHLETLIGYSAAPEAVAAKLADAQRSAAASDYSEGRLKEALKRLGRVLELAPGDLESLAAKANWSTEAGKADQAADCLVELARIHGESGAIDDAEAALRRRAELLPASVEAQRALGDFLNEHRGLDEAMPSYLAALSLARKSGDAESVRAEYGSLLKLRPSDASLRLEFVDFLCDQGDTESAGAELGELCSLLRTDEAKRGDLAHALERLISLSPGDFSLLEELANTQRVAGQEERAAGTYLEASREFEKSGDAESAIRNYRACLELTPDDAQTRTALAELLEREGRDKESLKQREILAGFYREKDDADSEAAQLEALLSLDAGRIDDRDRLGRIRFEQDRLDEAASQWRAALAARFEKEDWAGSIGTGEALRGIAPDNLEARSLLAEAYEQNGLDGLAKSEWLEIGRAQLGADEFDSAESSFSRILEIDPSDFGAGEQLAEVYLKKGKPGAASKQFMSLAEKACGADNRDVALRCWARVLEIKPKDTGVLERRAEFLLNRGDKPAALGDMIAAANEYSKAKSKKKLGKAIAQLREAVCGEPELRIDLGAALSEMDRLPEAIEETSAGVDELLERKEFESAGKACEAAFEWAPEDPGLRWQWTLCLAGMGEDGKAFAELLSLGDALVSKGNWAPAEKAFRQASEINPENLDALARLASTLRESGKPQEAFEELRRLGRMRLDREDRAGAAADFRAALDLRPDFREVRADLASVLAELGETAEAVNEFRSLAQDSFVAGDAEKASEWFDRILAIDPNDLETLKSRADLAAETQSFEDALPRYRNLIETAKTQAPDEVAGVFQDILGRFPDQLDLRRDYAEFLAGRDDAGAAIEEWFALADSASSQDQQDLALDALRAALELDPGSTTTLKRLVDLLDGMGRRHEAAVEALGMADLLLCVGQNDDAQGCCERACQLDGDSAQTWRRAAEILNDHGLHDEASGQLLRGAVELLKSGAAAEALELSQWGAGTFSQPCSFIEVEIDALEALERTDEALSLGRELAQMHIAEGRLGEAEETFRAMTEKSDGDPDVRLDLAEFLVSRSKSSAAAAEFREIAAEWRKRKNMGEAVENLGRAVDLDPDHIPSRQELAQILSAAGEFDQARGHYLAICRAQADGGQFDEAVKTHESLVKILPDDIEVFKGFLEALAQAGDRERHAAATQDLASRFVEMNGAADAIDALRRGLDVSPKDDGLLQALEELHDKEGESLKAAEIAEKRAVLASGSGRAEEAASLYAKAARGAPDDPVAQGRIAEALFTLGQNGEAMSCKRRQAALLMGREDFGAASRAFEECLKHSPQDSPARANYAECLAAQGQNPEAAENFAQAAEAFERGGDEAAALEMRRRISELAPDDIDNARTLSDMLMKQGETGEAFDRLGRLAGLCESNGEVPAAIEACRKMLECGEDEIDPRRRLARLHESGGAVHSAVEEIEKLAAALQKSEMLEEAAKELRHAMALCPDRLSLRKQLIAILDAQGKEEEALNDLEELAGAAEAAKDSALAIECLARLVSGPGDPAGELRSRLIGLYESAGQGEEANAERLALAGQHLEHGMVDAARAVCDAAIQRAADPQQCRALVAGLYEKSGIPELAAKQYLEMAREAREGGALEEATQSVNRGLRIRPKDISLREFLADLLVDLGRSEEALGELFILADQYENAGALEPALAAMARAAGLSEDNPAPLQRLVALHAKMGSIDEQAQCLSKLGVALERAGNLDAAAAAYRELLEAKPDDIESRMRYIDLYSSFGQEQDLTEDYFILAKQHVAAGNLVEATRNFERLNQIDPYHIPGRRAFLEFLESQGQRTRLASETLSFVKALEDRGDQREICRVLEYVVKCCPDEDSLLIAQGDIYARINMPGRATEIFRHLAGLYAKEGNRTGQIAALERALTLDPMAGDTRSMLIELLRAEGCNEEAVEHAFILAGQFAERGLLDLAERVYRDQLHQGGANVKVWQRLIETHLKIGTEEDLVPDLTILGDLLVRQGELREACRVFRRIIKIDPDQLEMRRKYIDTYLQIGLESELVKDYLELADGLKRRGDIHEAVQIYRRVLKIEPDNPRALENLPNENEFIAQARADISEDETMGPTLSAPSAAPSNSSAPGNRASLEKTARIYQNLLRINPANAAARVNLAEAFEQLGMKKEALREWDLASESFIEKGELRRGIEICERLLEQNYEASRIRDRLSSATIQRDSLKAIDSALSILGED